MSPCKTTGNTPPNRNSALWCDIHIDILVVLRWLRDGVVREGLSTTWPQWSGAGRLLHGPVTRSRGHSSLYGSFKCHKRAKDNKSSTTPWNKRPVGLDALFEYQLGHWPKFPIYSISSPWVKIELIFTLGAAVSEIRAKQGSRFGQLNRRNVESTRSHNIIHILLKLKALNSYPWRISQNMGQRCDNLITQKGHKTDPGKYRGITVTSALGKVFGIILRSRLTKFCEDNCRPTDECQISHRKKWRIVDNIFIMNTLFDKYWCYQDPWRIDVIRTWM